MHVQEVDHERKKVKSYRDQHCRSIENTFVCELQLKILMFRSEMRGDMCIQVVYYLCGVLCPAFDFVFHFTKKLGFGTSKMKKAFFMRLNKMHAANDDMDVIFRFLSFLSI
jgi:hypothetical protein